MEGASRLREVREVVAACAEYWETGKLSYEADVVAACEGLLLGGATEVVVLDNHASGNPANIGGGALPDGARLETWNVWDLPQHEVGGMLQVGYHARAGVDGFLSHTYFPGLRLRCDGELISESHGRAWAAQAPLLGIIGNDLDASNLGSLAGTPFLVVQESLGHGRARPVFGEREAQDAIRDFARECMEKRPLVDSARAPTRVTLAACLPHGDRVGETMAAGGWSRLGDVEYAVKLDTWADARGPIAAAMQAGFALLEHLWSNELTTPEKASSYDKDRATLLRHAFMVWADAREPDWVTAPTPAIGEV